jgi:hypothetical protein
MTSQFSIPNFFGLAFMHGSINHRVVVPYRDTERDLRDQAVSDGSRSAASYGRIAQGR